ncbi:hypothetical protein [Kyrpidia tusciae]|nr:hypothetical protein [Kyrpidia tusciae]
MNTAFGVLEVKGRLRDQEITKYTPHKEVKRILLKRYWENHA